MQTVKGSMVESLLGTAIGFVISVLVWQFVVNPLWGLKTTFGDNIAITVLFTVVSVIRSFYVRRFFNLMHTKNNKKAAYENIDRDSGPSPRG